MDISRGFDSIKQEHVDYFMPFTHEKPIIITKDTNRELELLGQVLYKTIAHVTDNYENFLEHMPRDEQELKVFEIFKKYPVQVGSFRTDFVVNKKSQLKIIEMTTRQPLNGYFTSGFFREIALRQAKKWKITDIVDRYPAFFKYLEDYIGEASHICVISGYTKKYEIKLYPQIFKAAGLECHIIPLNNLAKMTHLLENAWIIEELTFDEIKDIPIELLETLAKHRVFNNFLTLFHSHDKRFFNLLSKKSFLDLVLDDAEQSLLQKYLIPTYVIGEDKIKWDDAYASKGKYILKHKHLGKSVDIYAGSVTEESKWKSLFESGAIEDFILQEFVDQKLFEGRIGEEKRNDYIAGTLLYFNKEYFGPGLFRASSFPVSNIKEDRKIAPLVIKTNHRRENFHYL